jgi:nucleoside triphosphate pyrophosphatase
MMTARQKLVLASGSPQRRMLLLAAGYEFEVLVPSVRAECGVCSQESPPEYASRMAWQKALDVLDRVSQGPTPAGIVVACDTVVQCAGRILGKPTDAAHARQMLELLSGRVHHVYSGLCVWPRPGGSPQSQVAATRLRMDRLTADQLDEYVASGAWEGKAGAFGYQDRAGWLHLEEGSESNVIGLPLELLAELLDKLKDEGEGRKHESEDPNGAGFSG